MAIKIDTIFKGIRIAGAYCTVEMLSISTGKNLMGFHVLYRSDPEGPVFDTAVFSADYDLDDGNPFDQAYKHLKTLPEFVGYTDC